MSAADLPPDQLITLALDAIGQSAPRRLEPLLSPDVRVVTERGAHEGVDAVMQWAAKTYAHLDRRLVVADLEPRGDGVLGHGRVEYVWRESGEVGDTSPVFFAFRLTEGLLSYLSMHDDPASAAAVLDA